MNLRQQIAHLKQTADRAEVPATKVQINIRIHSHDAARLEQVAKALSFSSRTETAHFLVVGAIAEAADELGLTAGEA